MTRYNIALVSDYFYPSFGGIETHIEMLAINLINHGHKVIVITHKYVNHIGIKNYKNIKVYYLNIPVIAMNTSFPTLFSNFFLFAEIFTKEKINIVHGHQTMSNLAIESLFHAKTFNLKTILTEHSLFEVGGFENIVVNTINKLISPDIDVFICVSYTTKKNLMDRLNIESERIHVVPNGIQTDIFHPKPECRLNEKKWCVRNNDKENDRNQKLKIDLSKSNITEKSIKNINTNHNRIYEEIFSTNNAKITTINKEYIKIAVVSRFVKRKGVDLLIRIIPKVCSLYKRFIFIIVGDGPKRDEIEQMIDNFGLEKNVHLLGALSHNQIPDILRECDIFLNTSLTESFCMAILEASSCGLQVVSTNVGGIHEVLPENMITLTSFNDEDVINGLLKAKDKEINNQEMIFINKNFYSWPKIGKKTLDIYDEISEHERFINMNQIMFLRFITRIIYFFEEILFHIYEKYYHF